MRPALATTAFAFAALVAASCFAPVVERQCERDADCGSGWRCIATSCVPQNLDGGHAGGSGTTGGGIGGGPAGGGSAVGGGQGGGSATLCNAVNCPGCCSGNVCITLDKQSQTNCGTSGNACLSCNPNAVCKDGQCFGGVCDSTNCAQGCCLSNVCVTPNLQNQFACGIGGGICAGCGMGTCEQGACVAPHCDATNCSGGCCAGNVCIPVSAQTSSLCGIRAQACGSCPNNGTCSLGICGSTCDASSCPNGCCSFGACIPVNAQTLLSCGRGGQACMSCQAGQVCSGGTCNAAGCGPTTCMGCCLNGSCAGGNDQFACGVFGRMCASCPANSQCLSGSCQGCGGATCPTGCCQGGFCQQGNLDQACGDFGGVCQACAAGNSCQQQKCTPVGPPVDAGRPDAGGNLPTGAACTDNSQCQPPAGAFCLPQTLSMLNTGYTGGYCSRNCGATNPCPGGAVCITETFGMATNTSCKQLCTNPGSGQGTCRNGYICITSPTGLVGWCGPRCSNQSFPCPSGGTCDFSTGYCAP